MFKSFIDMSRPLTFYASSIVVLLIYSLLLTNLPFLQVSTYFDIPYRSEMSALCFSIGGLFGLISVAFQVKRSKAPWKFQQSQVQGFFLIAIVLFFLAISFSR